ncbi:MAG: hypothetical protein ACM3H9_03025 [Rhodospirillaceae bacterium]
MTIEKTAFQGWPNCYRVSNGTVEFISTTDVGPRIISFGFVGGANLFFVREDFAGQTGGAEWKNYGGHRLWHAPEDKVRTYEPDNGPIEAKVVANGLVLTMPPEPLSRIQKAIEITLDPVTSEVTVVHRLRNMGAWAVELAPWAISVMAPGGFAIAPLPTAFHPDRLLPNRALTLWPYTDMRDDRWLWGTDYILLRQRSGASPERERTKVGINANLGWAAYYLKPYLFIKRFTPVEGARYPDYNSSLEVFSNNRMLELETLAPLATLQPGATVTHVERWELHRNIELGFSEDDVRATVEPLVRQTR